MASQTLTDQTVASTYQGVLHANGEALPSAGIATVYDGKGTTSALSLGIQGNGAAIAGGLSCSGQLTAGDIRYTTTDSISGANFPLVSDGNKTAVFGQMTSRALIDLTPNPQGTYGNVKGISVNSKGLVTSVSTDFGRTAYARFVSKDETCTYTVNQLIITVTKIGHGLTAGQTVYLKKTTTPSSFASTKFIVQTANSTQFTVANTVGLPDASSGSLILDLYIKSSENVQSIERMSTGIYKLTFVNSFNNSNYATVCNAAYPNTTPTELENLQANVVSTANDSVTIRAFYITSGDQVIEYDDGDLSVICQGNSLQGGSSVSLQFNKYVFDNYSFGPAAGGTYNKTVAVTPAYMVSNNYTAIVIGSHLGNAGCPGTVQSFSHTTLINGSINSLLTSNMTNPYCHSYAYGVAFMFENKLYYHQFYDATCNTLGGTPNATYDTNSSDAINIIVGGMGVATPVEQARPCNILYFYNTVVNQSASCTKSWLTDLINNYFNKFQVVNSVNFNQTVVGNGSCGGTWATYHNFIRYVP